MSGYRGYRPGKTTADFGHPRAPASGGHGAVGKRTLVDTIYRSPARSAGGVAPPAARAALDKASGDSGEPLAQTTRAKLESSIGADLSDVRVHTGASSASAAAAIGANAYTVGGDIHFAAGQYDPAGNHLLAHEVAHTVQQKGATGVPQAQLTISSPGDAHEIAADRFADAFVANRAHPVAPASGIQGVVARDPVPAMDGGAMDAGSTRPAAGAHLPSAAGTGAPDASAAPAANACTPEEAQQQSAAALQAFESQVNQCVATPQQAPAAVGPVCPVELSSRPLNEALTEVMRGEGMTPAQISTVWSAVQRRVASSYGDFYNIIGGVQRAAYALLDVAESFERLGGMFVAAGTAMRNSATAFLTGQLPAIHTRITQQIASSAVDAIQSELHRTMPCLPEQAHAAVTGALPQAAFGAIDLTTGTSREVRFRFTSQCAAYRTAVQTAMETVAGTTFRPFITGNATGLQMEMLTAADQMARVAGAGTTIDAGHLHMNGGNAGDVQSMAWDVYQMQATSNNANLLVRNMVTGTGQNFDVVMTAVNASPTVNYDAFISNEVDLADIHAERNIPLPNTSNHPQSQESVYAHFMHERQYDATHSGADMAAIAAQARALEVQRQQLIADHNALPARVQTALNGGAVAPPLTPAEVAQANAWSTRAVAWQNAKNANDAAFSARFLPAHSYAIDQENAFNRERGFDDARPH